MLLLGIFLFATATIIAGEKKSAKAVETITVTCSLSGIVVDKSTGEPLTGVEVGIEGTDLKAYTDFDGGYTFENLSPGEYSVSASLISYRCNGSKSIKLNVNKEHLNIELETACN